jgi:hypothetical protein
MDVAHRPGPHPLAQLANAIVAVALVSELSNHIVTFCGRHQCTYFVHIVCKWLLAVHMLAMLHGFHGDHCMRMVGRADYHGINIVLELVQHHAEVFVSLRVGILVELVLGVLLINIAEGDQCGAFGHHRVDISTTLAADPDAGEAYLAEGSRCFLLLLSQYGLGRKVQQRCTCTGCG